MRSHVNSTSTRAAKVTNQEEGDGNHNRQDQKHQPVCPTSAKADQELAADADARLSTQVATGMRFSQAA
jgi:hypothetical protein